MTATLLEAKNTPEVLAKFGAALDTFSHLSNSATLFKATKDDTGEKIITPIGDKSAIYLAAFIYPELKDTVNRIIATDFKERGAADNGERAKLLNTYAVKIAVPDGFNREDNGIRKYIHAHPLIQLIDAARAGFIESSSVMIPNSGKSPDEISDFGTSELVKRMDDINKAVSDASFTTAAKADLIKTSTEWKSKVENAIGGHTLFGFDLNSLDSDTVKYLRMMEHWFYYLVSRQNRTTRAKEEHHNIAANTAVEIFYTCISELDKLIHDDEVAETLTDLETQLSTSVMEQDAGAALDGQLLKKKSIAQLGAVLAFSINTTDATTQINGGKGISVKASMLNILKNAAGDDNDKVEVYTNGLNKISGFWKAISSALKGINGGTSVKANTLRCSFFAPAINTLSQELKKSDAARASSLDIVSRLIDPANNYTNITRSTSDAVSELFKRLKGERGLSHADIAYAPVTMGIILDNNNNTAGDNGPSLLSSLHGTDKGSDLASPAPNGTTGADPSEAGGIADADEAVSSNEFGKEAGISSQDAGGSSVNAARKNKYMNVMSRYDLLTDGEKVFNDESVEIYEIDPVHEDVKGSRAVPANVIPLFTQTLNPPSGTQAETVDSNMTSDAFMLLSYAAIAYADDGIKAIPGFTRTITQDDTDSDSSDDTDGENVSLSFGIECNPNSAKNAVETYFTDIVGSEGAATNAVNKRNLWISALTSRFSVSEIIAAVSTFLKTKYSKQLDAKRIAAESNKDKSGVSFDSDEHVLRLVGDVFRKVSRYVFNIMNDSGDTKVCDGSVTAKKVSPRPIINSSKYGRLRLTAGNEGTLGKNGRLISKKMPATVIDVKDTRDGAKYAIKFGGDASKVGTITITSDELDDWEPDILCIAPDSQTGTPQYALWSGIRFVSPETGNGPISRMQVPDDSIDMMTRSQLGERFDSNGNANVFSAFSRDMHGDTGGMTIHAVNAIGCNISKLNAKNISDVMSVLNYASELSNEDSATIKELVKVSNILKTPAPTLTGELVEACEKCLIAHMETLCESDNAGEGISISANAYISLGKLLSYCIDAKSSSGNNTLYLNRLGNVLDALCVTNGQTLALEYLFDISNITDYGVSLQVYDAPQYHNLRSYDTVASELAKVIPEVVEAQTKVSNARNLGNVAESNKSTDSEIAEYSAVVQEAITEAESALWKLNQLYSLDVEAQLPDSASLSTAAKRKCHGMIEKSNTKDFYYAIIELLQAVKRGASQNPAANEHTIMEIYKAYANAHAMVSGSLYDYDGEDSVDMGRQTFDAPDDADMSSVNEMDPSAITLEDRIHEDDIEDFDPSTHNDYSDLSGGCVMLGKMATSASGNQTGNGMFSASAGISPAEFNVILHSLDSAHAIVAESNAVSQSNAGVRNYMIRKHLIVDYAINGFYDFMTSQTALFKRDIVDELGELQRWFSGIADGCENGVVQGVLNDMNDVLTNLVAKVNNQNNEVSPNEDVDATMEAIAREISTTIGNIILQLEAYAKTTYLPGDIDNIAQSAGRPDRLIDTASVIGMSSGETAGRNAVDSYKQGLAIYRDMNLLGLAQSPDQFVDSLATVSDYLGMRDTAGYRGALDPFSDMLLKITSKSESGTRNIYNGDVPTQLASALVYALVSDEHDGGTSYNRLAAILESLVNKGADANADGNAEQKPIALPAFLVDGFNKDTASSSELKEYLFDENFNAVDSVVHMNKFNGLSSLNGAFASKSSNGGPGFTDSDGVEIIARKMRTFIVDTKLSNCNALNVLMRKESATTSPIFIGRLERFKSAMNEAAGKILGDDKFVQLSVLYQCIDTFSLHDIKRTEIERAASIVQAMADKADEDEIMRIAFGDKYAEDVQLPEDMYAKRDALADCIFGILEMRKDSDSTDGVLKETAISSEFPTDDGPDTLSGILGKDLAEKLFDVLVEQIDRKTLDAMQASELKRAADDFIDNAFNIAAGSANTNQLSTISECLVKLATGEKTFAEMIADIRGATDIDADTLRPIIREFYFRLGYTPRDAADGAKDWALPKNARYTEHRIRNVANRVVNAELTKRGAFNVKLGNTELNAAKRMDGTVPTREVEYINNIGGLDKLFARVNEILLDDDLDSNKANDYLSKTEFKLTKREFNDYVSDLHNVLTALVGSARKYAEARLKVANGTATTKVRAMMSAHAFGSDARSTTDGGIRRRAAAASLNETVAAIKKEAGYSETQHDADVTPNSDTNNPVDEFVNGFIEKYAFIKYGQRDNPNELTAFLERTDKKNTNGAMYEDLANIRTQLADVLSSSRYCYTQAALKIVNAAAGSRGVNTSVKLSYTDGEQLLDSLSVLKGSPVKELPNDRGYNNCHYSINDIPMDTERLVVILNDALSKYADMVVRNGMPAPDADENASKSPSARKAESVIAKNTDLATVNIDDFLSVLKSGMTMKRDSGIDTKTITEMLLATMAESGRITRGKTRGTISCIGQIEVPNQDGGANRKTTNVTAELLIPVRTVMSSVSGAIRTMTFNGAGDDIMKLKQLSAQASSRSAIDVSDTMKTYLIGLFNRVMNGMKNSAETALKIIVPESDDATVSKFYRGLIPLIDKSTGIAVRVVTSTDGRTNFTGLSPETDNVYMGRANPAAHSAEPGIASGAPDVDAAENDGLEEADFFDDESDDEIGF